MDQQLINATAHRDNVFASKESVVTNAMSAPEDTWEMLPTVHHAVSASITGMIS